MKHIGLIMLAVLFLLTLAIPAGAARKVKTAASLKPFSPQTKYMSMQGYLRWKKYHAQKVWNVEKGLQRR